MIEQSRNLAVNQNGTGQGEPTPAGMAQRYRLSVPADLTDRGIEPDERDPLYLAASEWAMRHNLSQDDFDELAAMFYQREASLMDESSQDIQIQRRRFIEKFAPPSFAGREDEDAFSIAERNARPVTNWVGGLLGPAFQEDPELLEVYRYLLSTADGVRFLATMKRVIGEPTPVRFASSSAPARKRSREEILYGDTTPNVGTNQRPKPSF